MKSFLVFLGILILLAGIVLVSNLQMSDTRIEPASQEVAGTGRTGNTPVLGRWDITVYAPDGVFPSWVEFSEEDSGLAGRFVGRFGSARPLEYVHFDGATVTFSLPPQYEQRTDDLVFVGGVSDGVIDGTTTLDGGGRARFRAKPAPALDRTAEPSWGDPVELIRGSSLRGWQPRDRQHENGWSADNGVLTNTPPSGDLVTSREFDDFRLHAEFRLRENGNSGIYLRGRYEVQLSDSFGEEPESHLCGGIYGFLTPEEMAVRPAGDWNEVDITLVGRTVTIDLNGVRIIDGGEIPGITGGALDSRETEPGPLMLQGDHGFVQFRNIVIRPAAR